MLELLLTLAVLVSTTFTIILLTLPSRYVSQSLGPAKSKQGAGDAPSGEPKTSVQVLVLGDIGRSPRMQYHAMSIAKHGGKVTVIGYKESALHPGLLDNPLITIAPLSPPPLLITSSGLPFLIAGPLKVFWQVWTLWMVLGYRTAPARWLLVQNPPSIPTLLLSLLLSLLRNTHLLIDWHNYGWTILAGTRGPHHPFVRASRAYEVLLARWAPTASFAVTDAMARQLRRPPYSVRSPVLALHDRPADVFRPLSGPGAREDLLRRLEETRGHADDILAGRTRLLVSSTSWTPDEDFGLLLDALVAYSAAAAAGGSIGASSSGNSSSITTTTTRAGASNSSGSGSSSTRPLPHILALVTGKGPQQQQYLARVAGLRAAGRLGAASVATAWLPTADYARLLASADLGVSLHRSSSGVDLPMKVVDMFGAGLPVAGYAAYEAWPELVAEGVNGRGFATAGALARVLAELFGEARDGAGQRGELARLREGAAREGSRRWDDEWDKVAGRVLGVC